MAHLAEDIHVDVPERETEPGTEGRSSDDGDATQGQVEESRTRTRTRILKLVKEGFQSDPGWKKKTLSQLHGEAAQLQKHGMEVEAVAAYAKVFRKMKEEHLTHPEVYITHSNRSTCYLNLGLYEEALWDAQRCQVAAEAAWTRKGMRMNGGWNGATAPTSYIKAFGRKGSALLGMNRNREALEAFQEGLQYDPFSEEMKRGMEHAQQAVLGDILQGKGMEKKALPAPGAKQRITYHEYSAPLHKVKTEDMLPNKLLTPFQAENDHNIKDTYNYVTVQADIRLPKRHLKFLEDEYLHEKMERAIVAAIGAIHASDRDCRVLDLGAGAGLHTMMALRAGARHVTACERWLYLAMSCKEELLTNGFNDDQVKVVYKRPTDLSLLKDVPIVCNLLVCNMLEPGLLAAGILPSVRHALDNLLTSDAIVLPASATVYAQAIELRSGPVCGFDLQAINKMRWHPAYVTTGPTFCKDAYVPLSSPFEVWHLDMLNPPEECDQKTIDVQFERSGTWNAVMFWYDLHLAEGIHLSTGPHAVEEGLKSLQPAIQYLDGEMRVEADAVMPLNALHNTVRIKFEVPDAEYSQLSAADASFPHYQFNILADERRNEAYFRAINRAVTRKKERGEDVHALDMGAGSGLLSIMAASSGADTVVAAEMHESLAKVARRAAAANGLSERITVVERDVALLERGQNVRAKGVNLIICDMFDAGLLGDGVLYMLEKVKRQVAQPDAAVIPAAATIYAMGVEIYTNEVRGFDMSPMNKYRWDKGYEAVHMESVPHRRLTKPKKVFEYFFDGIQKGRGRENVLKLEVTETGYMNGICFWFDLHLDEEDTITTAPEGISKSGLVVNKGNVATLAREFSEVANLQEPSPPPAEGSSVDGAENLHCSEGRPQSQPADCAAGEPGQEAVTSRDLIEIQLPTKETRAPHYWGQALQYLERGVQVEPGKKITVLAKRENNQIRFSLREGVGSWVGKSPWKIQWGGGASVESPHFQRVHYCELLVRDFLMRVRCKRFPPIEKDMKMVLAHCGSLLLDPATLAEVYHEFVILEAVHSTPEFSPGASMESLTKPPLFLA